MLDGDLVAIGEMDDSNAEFGASAGVGGTAKDEAADSAEVVARGVLRPAGGTDLLRLFVLRLGLWRVRRGCGMAHSMAQGLIVLTARLGVGQSHVRFRDPVEEGLVVSIASDEEPIGVGDLLGHRGGVLLGLVGWWNARLLGHAERVVVPYAHALGLLPSFLQQLVLESNGKRVDRDGRPVARPTAPVVGL